MVVAQLPDITEEARKQGQALIKEYTHNYILANGYYMLLCNELRYYTVFIVNKEYEENVEDVVFECLEHIGTIKQINMSNDNKFIECWVTNKDGCFMFVLFNYEDGVITCR